MSETTVDVSPMRAFWAARAGWMLDGFGFVVRACTVPAVTAICAIDLVWPVIQFQQATITWAGAAALASK